MEEGKAKAYSPCNTPYPGKRRGRLRYTHPATNDKEGKAKKYLLFNLLTLNPMKMVSMTVLYDIC